MDKKPRVPPFTVSLTDEERARLEQHRAALGVRSLAHVVRYWISKPVPGRKMYEDFIDKLAAHTEGPSGANPLAGIEPSIGRPKPDYGSRLKKR